MGNCIAGEINGLDPGIPERNLVPIHNLKHFFDRDSLFCKEGNDLQVNGGYFKCPSRSHHILVTRAKFSKSQNVWKVNFIHFSHTVSKKAAVDESKLRVSVKGSEAFEYISGDQDLFKALNGGQCFQIVSRIYPRTDFDRQHAIERAKCLIGRRRYHPSTNNCEHFLRFLLEGIPFSRHKSLRSSLYSDAGSMLRVSQPLNTDIMGNIQTYGSLADANRRAANREQLDSRTRRQSVPKIHIHSDKRSDTNKQFSAENQRGSRKLEVSEILENLHAPETHPDSKEYQIPEKHPSNYAQVADENQQGLNKKINLDGQHVPQNPLIPRTEDGSEGQHARESLPVSEKQRSVNTWPIDVKQPVPEIQHKTEKKHLLQNQHSSRSLHIPTTQVISHGAAAVAKKRSLKRINTGGGQNVCQPDAST